MRALATSAPVRAVDVAEGNIAQAEFISAEHFNRKGPPNGSNGTVWGIQNNSRDYVAAVVLERAKGVEPSSKAWEALVLPMNYARVFVPRAALRPPWDYHYNPNEPQMQDPAEKNFLRTLRHAEKQCIIKVDLFLFHGFRALPGKGGRMLISPSILAADFANLARDAALAAEGGADLLHVDVMDGHFVPNITVGIPVVRSLAKAVTLPLDIHLMIDDPARYAEEFCRAGASILTVHFESPSSASPADTLRAIRALGVRAGLSIKPATPVEIVRELLPLCDLLLVMTVEPGFGGQKFLPGSLERIAEARRLIDALNPSCLLEIDGGVDETNVAACAEAGADVAVMGSAVFRDDPRERLVRIRSALGAE